MAEYSVGQLEAMARTLRAGTALLSEIDDAAGMLRAYAERIEADEVAVPVAYANVHHFKQVNDGFLAMRKPSEFHNVPLFAHPPAQEFSDDALRAFLIKALMDYRCSRTVDEEGDGLPLVDVLSPGEGGTIKPGMEEIEILAECLMDEWPNPTAQAAQVEGFSWDNFPSWLIDKCEGETITEEFLQRQVAAMLEDSRYNAPPAEPAAQGEAEVIAWMREQAATLHTDNFDCDGPRKNHRLAYAIEDAADCLATQPRAVPDEAINMLRRSRDDEDFSTLYRQAMRDAVGQLENFNMLVAAPSPGESA
ncbi:MULTISPECIES: hypothetical protein [unclassified Rhodanobacter]|uniref:hypothetical protein n=1 Tax=unclassified Rhodanobacter TaxID=2621553 RepID=UPI001BDF20BE|nr:MULTISPECIES: hypothetical protein [unclassified Rhodanobacter]MBT2142736.1 hypothetical protein [Rhodanobacter sp. LX-99]MBT2148191.1 hypothetical protein [Rhodanobacter sp. LX-100]